MPPTRRYPFEAYLVHLHGEKDAAQRTLSAAQQRHLEEQQRLTDRIESRKQLQRDQQRWQEGLDDGLRAARWTVAEMELRRNHLKRLRSDLDDHQRAILAQRHALERAEHAVEERRRKLHEIASQTKVHEDRKERWREELRREEQRLEQKQMEEISQAIHERKRREER